MGIIEYLDVAMAFDPSVGWGKVGLGYCVGSALDRVRASCAAGWDTTSDTNEEAA